LSVDIIRIVSHADCFDGLVCALLLQEVLGIEEVVFVTPAEIQNGSFHVHKNDAVADLPYPQSGCGLWFDHHSSNSFEPGPNHFFDPAAKSCASVIYRKYAAKLGDFATLVAQTDMIDAGEISEAEVKSPGPAVQLAISLQSGNVVKDEQYREFLLQELRLHPLEHVVAMNIVQKRVEHILAEDQKIFERLEELATVHGKVLVLDLSGEQSFSLLFIFMLYLTYPQVSVSIVLRNNGDKVRVHLGENSFARSNFVDLGALAKQYGGGGHSRAAGCTIPASSKEEIIQQLLIALNS
jgi:oligoribonuclease NrnB/cAMP/cGMP phosphodiesterase (DHH superfamily)